MTSEFANWMSGAYNCLASAKLTALGHGTQERPISNSWSGARVTP